MKVAYQGFDRGGKSINSTIDARDTTEAAELLRRQGIFATELQAAADGATASAGRRGSPLGKGKRLKLVTMFLRQMHVLMATGTPLAESLSALERQCTDDTFRGIIARLRENVEQGLALSLAMEAFPAYFNAVCRGLVAAGESGGNLDAMLDRLAILSRKQVHVRASVIGAMIYPALLTVVAVVVLCTLLTFVLPRFGALFASLDTPLPPTTKFLMMLSTALRSYWWALPPAIGGAAFGTWAFLKTDAGRRRLHWLTISAPQFGAIVRSFETARITRLLGILVQGKVTLLDALALTKSATTNWYYAQMLTRAEDAITRGDSLAGAFDGKLVPSSVCEAVRSGERSGQLGTLLSTLADFLDEENDVTLRSLTSIIEPIILIVLGVLVGFIAISMFMPLFDLTAATGAK